MKIGLDVDELGQQQRKRELHPQSPNATPSRPAEKPQHQRLQQIDLHNLSGARTQRLHDGNRIQPLLQMRSHSHRHADRTKHQRNKTHQRQETRRAIQPLRQRRIGLAVINHLRLWQELFQPRLQVRDSLVRDRSAIPRLRNLEQIPLSRMASGSQQPARIKAFTRDEEREDPRQSSPTADPAHSRRQQQCERACVPILSWSPTLRWSRTSRSSATATLSAARALFNEQQERVQPLRKTDTSPDRQP